MARNPHASYEASDHQRMPIIPIANNLTTTVSGYALDARQGKALSDALSDYSLSTSSSSDHPKIEFSISAGGSFTILMYSNYISPTNNYGRRLVCTPTELRFESETYLYCGQNNF